MSEQYLSGFITAALLGAILWIAYTLIMWITEDYRLQKRFEKDQKEQMLDEWCETQQMIEKIYNAVCKKQKR